MIELIVIGLLIIVGMFFVIRHQSRQIDDLNEDLGTAMMEVNQERHIAERTETRDKRVVDKVKEVEDAEFRSLFGDTDPGKRDRVRGPSSTR